MKNSIRTKIIATIGPSSNSEETILKLIDAGARSFRINTSHGAQQEHLAIIQCIRKAAKELNLYLPIILDLQGPKIRVGKLSEPINLIKDEIVTIKPDNGGQEKNVITVDYPDIVKDLSKGNTLLLDDGKIELKIIEIEQDEIKANVIDGGILHSRKGVNVPSAKLNIPSITPRDIEFIKFAVNEKVDFIALSFVRNKEDIINAKNHIKNAGEEIAIIAKIEKPEAIENLDEIIAVSEGILIARGDLGIEISPEKVPVVQKNIIKKVNSTGKMVITATQMLESMMKEPIPTRAEASDVANAIIDGTDALLLTGETAVGQFPVKTVNMMKLIAENVEKSNLCKCNTYEILNNGICGQDSQSIANAAIRILQELRIDAVIAFTRSGFTGRLISKAKPAVPVLSISDSETVCKQLNLFWGVFPYYMEFSPNFTEEFLRRADQFLLENTFLEKGDKIIIIGGMPCLAKGKTNFLRIYEIGEV